MSAYERGEGPVRAEGVLQVVHRLMIGVSLGRLVSEIGLDYRHGCFLKKNFACHWNNNLQTAEEVNEVLCSRKDFCCFVVVATCPVYHVP